MRRKAAPTWARAPGESTVVPSGRVTTGTSGPFTWFTPLPYLAKLRSAALEISCPGRLNSVERASAAGRVAAKAAIATTTQTRITSLRWRRIHPVNCLIGPLPSTLDSKYQTNGGAGPGQAPDRPRRHIHDARRHLFVTDGRTARNSSAAPDRGPAALSLEDLLDQLDDPSQHVDPERRPQVDHDREHDEGGGCADELQDRPGGGGFHGRQASTGGAAA